MRPSALYSRPSCMSGAHARIYMHFYPSHCQGARAHTNTDTRHKLKAAAPHLPSIMPVRVYVASISGSESAPVFSTNATHAAVTWHPATPSPPLRPTTCASFSFQNLTCCSPAVTIHSDTNGFHPTASTASVSVGQECSNCSPPTPRTFHTHSVCNGSASTAAIRTPSAHHARHDTAYSGCSDGSSAMRTQSSVPHTHTLEFGPVCPVAASFPDASTEMHVMTAVCPVKNLFWLPPCMSIFLHVYLFA